MITKINVYKKWLEKFLEILYKKIDEDLFNVFG